MSGKVKIIVKKSSFYLLALWGILLATLTVFGLTSKKFSQPASNGFVPAALADTPNPDPDPNPNPGGDGGNGGDGGDCP